MLVKSSLHCIFRRHSLLLLPLESRWWLLTSCLLLMETKESHLLSSCWWERRRSFTTNFFFFRQLNFEDVLAEPDVAHGFDPIWRSAYILFTGSRFWIYRLLSAFLALPLALVWGVTFSLITFFSVWFATPILRIMDVFLFYIRRVKFWFKSDRVIRPESNPFPVTRRSGSLWCRRLWSR